MSSIYDAVATRALATITKKGAPVSFPIAGSGGVYDPITDRWSGGSAPSTVIGRAVQIEGDPDRFAALGLVLVNPVTLMIAAKGLAITPAPGTEFEWAGVRYTTKDVDATGPDGVPIIYVVTGSA